MHEKTNNVVSDQVRHLPSCTITERWLEAGNLELNCTIRVDVVVVDDDGLDLCFPIDRLAQVLKTFFFHKVS